VLGPASLFELRSDIVLVCVDAGSECVRPGWRIEGWFCRACKLKLEIGRGEASKQHYKCAKRCRETGDTCLGM